VLAGAGAAVSERRLLLFGGSGRLGRALQREAGSDWTVIAPSRDELDLALADVRDLQMWIKASAPEVVLNAAAMAWVDACEEDPVTAAKINARLPGVAASACRLEVIPLIHISTDYVFGDESGGGSAPYSEDSPVSPLQSYGRSKARGEQAVLAAGGSVSVVRVSWLTDSGEDTFVRYLLGQVRTGRNEVAVLRDQRTRPTMTGGLARWLLAVAERLADGVAVPSILHPAGCESVCRGEWAEAILASRGYGALEVIDDPGQRSALPYAVQGATQIALRPVDSSLDARVTMRWSQEHGLPELEDWREVQHSEDGSG
jgi:dTDP-4-dehydrorhamnose reductase